MPVIKYLIDINHFKNFKRFFNNHSFYFHSVLLYILIFGNDIIFLLTILPGPRREKTCLRRFANNTGADQPAHPRSLISAFVIRVLLSTISKLATSEISFV